MGMDLIYVRLSAKSQTHSCRHVLSECGTSHMVRVLLSIPVPEKLQDKVAGVALASKLKVVAVWAK